MSKAIMELKTNEMNVASSKFDKSKNVGFFLSDSTIGDTVYPSRPSKVEFTGLVGYLWESALLKPIYLFTLPGLL